ISRNATEASGNAFAIFRATVVFPDPVPPAMPIMSGFTGPYRKGSIAGDDAQASLQIEACVLSRYCIGDRKTDGRSRKVDVGKQARFGMPASGAAEPPGVKLDWTQATVNQCVLPLATAMVGD